MFKEEMYFDWITKACYVETVWIDNCENYWLFNTRLANLFLYKDSLLTNFLYKDLKCYEYVGAGHKRYQNSRISSN